MKGLLFFILGVVHAVFAQKCHLTLIPNAIGELRGTGNRMSDISLFPSSRDIISKKITLYICAVFYCLDDTHNTLTSIQFQLSNKAGDRKKLLHKFKTADESNSSCFKWKLPNKERIRFIKPTYVAHKKTGLKLINMLFVTTGGHGRTIGA